MREGEESKNPLPAVTPMVGYGKPPVEHRFKKGRSGNPRGRPKKKRQAQTGWGPTLEGIVMVEAYRLITIRENNEPVTLPMIQAVTRSLGVAAVKGSHRAQIAIAGMVQAIEERQYEQKLSLLKTIIEYKDAWREVFERCDRDGEPRPDPLPHPDDLAVDLRTCMVIYNGPFDDAEKATWDKFKQRKAEAIEEIAFLRKQTKRRKNKSSFDDPMIELEERTVNLVDRLFPDAAIRRQPDFNIHEWRDRQAKIQEITAESRALRNAQSQGK